MYIQYDPKSSSFEYELLRYSRMVGGYRVVGQELVIQLQAWEEQQYQNVEADDKTCISAGKSSGQTVISVLELSRRRGVVASFLASGGEYIISLACLTRAIDAITQSTSTANPTTTETTSARRPENGNHCENTDDEEMLSLLTLLLHNRADVACLVSGRVCL